MRMNFLNNQKNLLGIHNIFINAFKLNIKKYLLHNYLNKKGTKFIMKLAFSSNAYTNFSLINSIVDTSKIGYKGIEIMCDSPHAFPLPLEF